MCASARVCRAGRVDANPEGLATRRYEAKNNPSDEIAFREGRKYISRCVKQNLRETEFGANSWAIKYPVGPQNFPSWVLKFPQLSFKKNPVRLQYTLPNRMACESYHPNTQNLNVSLKCLQRRSTGSRQNLQTKWGAICGKKFGGFRKKSYLCTCKPMETVNGVG